MPEKFETPVYARIALDLARKIASGELAAGSRLSGRSLLSSTYRVSPETIRAPCTCWKTWELSGLSLK